MLGCTLYVATPVMSRLDRFLAVKNARVVSPGRTRTLFCVGTNLHGIPSATSALNEMTTSLFAAAALTDSGRLRCSASLSSSVRRLVVPPKPVAWQNMRYNGTEA